MKKSNFFTISQELGGSGETIDKYRINVSYRGDIQVNQQDQNTKVLFLGNNFRLEIVSEVDFVGGVYESEPEVAELATVDGQRLYRIQQINPDNYR